MDFATNYHRYYGAICQAIKRLNGGTNNLSNGTPFIVVVGNQSAGKTTLLEMLAGGVPFFKDYATATRCVTRVSMYKKEVINDIAVQVSIQRANGAPEFVADIRTSELSKLPKTFLEAQKKLLADRKFTDELVLIDIYGSDCDLVLYDLPGLIRHHEEDGSLVDLIQNIASDYVNKQNAIVVAVLSLDDQLEAAAIQHLTRVNKVDPRRIVKVLTKPDYLETKLQPNEVPSFLDKWGPVLTGGGPESAYVVQGYIHAMLQGNNADRAWEVYRNNRELELQTLARYPRWRELYIDHPERFGVANLVRGLEQKMSSLLKDVAGRTMADMEARIRQHAKYLEERTPEEDEAGSAKVSDFIVAIDQHFRDIAECKDAKKMIIWNKHNQLVQHLETEFTKRLPSVNQPVKDNDVVMYVNQAREANVEVHELPNFWDNLNVTKITAIMQWISVRNIPKDVANSQVHRILRDHYVELWRSLTVTHLREVKALAYSSLKDIIQQHVPLHQHPGLFNHLRASVDMLMEQQAKVADAALDELKETALRCVDTRTSSEFQKAKDVRQELAKNLDLSDNNSGNVMANLPKSVSWVSYLKVQTPTTNDVQSVASQGISERWVDTAHEAAVLLLLDLAVECALYLMKSVQSVEWHMIHKVSDILRHFLIKAAPDKVSVATATDAVIRAWLARSAEEEAKRVATIEELGELQQLLAVLKETEPARGSRA